MDRQILPNSFVDDVRHILNFLSCHFGGMRKIESQTLRRDVASFLCDVGTQHLSKRLMQQVGCRMQPDGLFRMIGQTPGKLLG
jgi:hypothetical protein